MVPAGALRTAEQAAGLGLIDLVVDRLVEIPVENLGCPVGNSQWNVDAMRDREKIKELRAFSPCAIAGDPLEMLTPPEWRPFLKHQLWNGGTPDCGCT
ncbi:MAG: hypothetical protein ACOCUN_00265 [Jiangellaceae bacterium]